MWVESMPSDKMIGGVILAVSILGIAVYGHAIYYYTLLTLQITALLAVGSILAIIAWIGYTMATTPPPEPTQTEGVETSKEQTVSKSV